MSWWKRQTGPIGIDFGSRAVRMLQLERQEGPPVVRAAASVEYPPGSVEGDERRQAAMKAVQNMLRRGSFVGRRVVTAVSNADLHVKNLRLPVMPDEELGAAVRFEAAERFDFHDQHTEYRHLPVGTIRSGNESQQEVAVLAVPGDALRAQIEMLNELGLTVEALDVVPCAAFRPFERFLRRGPDAEQVNAFVDLGASGTRIVVTRGQDIIFLKTFDVGGEHFDGLVAEALAIEVDEAAALRWRLAGGDDETDGSDTIPITPGQRDRVWSAVEPAAHQLGKEIGLCLRYCTVTFRVPRCESVTCVGGQALDEKLLVRMGDAVGVPLRKGHPLRDVACDGAFAPTDQATGLSDWAVAFGLALKPVIGSGARRVG
ncbi:MAG: pilus assembly protein PilM [bacterium]|nr:pilus assembly protein PilM [bacterium]